VNPCRDLFSATHYTFKTSRGILAALRLEK